MAEIRLKDTVPHHPKFLRAGAAACWLYTCGIGYCQRLHTDGFIPRETLPTLGVNADENPLELAAKLVDARLWDACDGGWRIHDYLHENKSARQIRQLSRKRQVSGRRGGESNAARFGKQNESKLPVGEEASCFQSAKPRSAKPRRDRDRDRDRPCTSDQQALPITCKEPAAADSQPVENLLTDERRVLAFRRQRSKGMTDAGRPKLSTITAIARTVLMDRPTDEEGELADRVKTACAQTNLLYDTDTVARAIERARGQLDRRRTVR